MENPLNSPFNSDAPIARKSNNDEPPSQWATGNRRQNFTCRRRTAKGGSRYQDLYPSPLIENQKKHLNFRKEVVDQLDTIQYTGTAVTASGLK